MNNWYLSIVQVMLLLSFQFVRGDLFHEDEEDKIVAVLQVVLDEILICRKVHRQQVLVLLSDSLLAEYPIKCWNMFFAAEDTK